MEESKIRDAVKNSSQEIMQILKETSNDDIENTERFLRFTLNEARDERQILSSKKFIYDIGIVTIEAVHKMVVQDILHTTAKSQPH